MDYKNIFNKVEKLKIGENISIYTSGNYEIYIYRPIKQFKNYDINKNFQIYLKLPNGREFRPNHLIVMIDLNLRIRSNSEEKVNILNLFDSIFYKENFIDKLEIIKNTKFEHSLYNIDIISVLYLLFLIEQDYNYPDGKSKYNPKTLFLHGWVRQFVLELKEIDNLVMSVCNRQPPRAIYTREEDLNNKKYNENYQKLWYLDN